MSYVVKQPFEAGERPLNYRQYRVGDRLTDGDVAAWPEAMLKGALASGRIVAEPEREGDK